MDTKNTYQIRDIKSGNIIGVKNEDSIVVPEKGQIEDFVIQYQALENYDMGMVAEIYDQDIKKVDRFVILYAFKEVVREPSLKSREFRVLEASLSNLDVLEIIHQSNAKKEK